MTKIWFFYFFIQIFKTERYCMLQSKVFLLLCWGEQELSSQDLVYHSESHTAHTAHHGRHFSPLLKALNLFRPPGLKHSANLNMTKALFLPLYKQHKLIKCERQGHENAPTKSSLNVKLILRTSTLQILRMLKILSSAWARKENSLIKLFASKELSAPGCEHPLILCKLDHNNVFTAHTQ